MTATDPTDKIAAAIAFPGPRGHYDPSTTERFKRLWPSEQEKFRRQARAAAKVVNDPDAMQGGCQ